MKSNLEHNIKTQLENREIPVSENAWDRLQQMMDEPEIASPQKTNKRWIPLSIAASMLLLIGIFWTMSAKVEPNFKENQIVKSTESEEVIPEINKTETPEIVQPQKVTKEEKPVLASNSKPVVNERKPKIDDSQHQAQNSLEEEKTIETTPFMDDSPALVTQTEIKQEEPQKPNYVDPEMLLYSIENNNAVIQSNSDFRVVIKNFNK